MAYSYDQNTGDIIINGWEEGIAASPYDGIADIRNANITSIPHEVSVGFSTSQISSPGVATGTVTSANVGTDYLTYTGAAGLENYMAIVFSVTTVTGISINTTYWIKNLNGAGAGTFQLTSDYAQISLVDVTGNGTGTFSVAVIGKNLITGATTAVPKFPLYLSGVYFIYDTSGALWSNVKTTTSGYWTYTGPSGTSDTNSGQGIVGYTSSVNGNSWVFTFNSSSIDYFNLQSYTWVYGWKPSTGANSQTNYLNTATGILSGGHKSILGPDNKVYYCDGDYIGRWYQANPTVAFDPTNTATYIFDQTSLLPLTDAAQSLAFLGNNLLIGGLNNIIYPWDTFSYTPSFPIFVPESNIVNLLNVSTNVFIFAGNRGRIYVTNISNVNLFKKIPDSISGTVEPYYTWGGVTSNKNQLYFSFSVTSNTSVQIPNYGGIWAIDLASPAYSGYTDSPVSMRLLNQLSYGTYSGLATALIPNYSTVPAGTGLFAGWNSMGITPTYGIDISSSMPYTSGQTTIDSDLIPIGTVLKPNTDSSVEFKLAVPIVSGESVQIQYRQKFSDSFSPITGGIFNFANIGTVWNGYSGIIQNVNFQQSQWLQIRAVLISTVSSPSYVRLTEIRIRQK